MIVKTQAASAILLLTVYRLQNIKVLSCTTTVPLPSRSQSSPNIATKPLCSLSAWGRSFSHNFPILVKCKSNTYRGFICAVAAEIKASERHSTGEESLSLTALGHNNSAALSQWPPLITLM